MLTADVKRRIDTARDILVGKVPDPKSQVEQITIALIYKFMDDMDAQAEEFGGKRSFFAAEFAKYGWSKLLHSGLGGHEMLNLYAEAIAKMPENPGIPKLFREIFKNAFLPYRDPETLREFLKTIDCFTYDHSEDLGDAYEYLLSVLGSQGDAGQFRTPRHIIDFMVAIIGPKKDESILDPACGTAGFLISAYKHIIAANTDVSGVCSLTPDEKKRLAANIMGYDISPDMVRLSQVNLYLHGFVDPHIFEYDTLTSQEKWDEYANTIFANPPFMSPKGGIKPHNRFSVQSKRSEVLFVDYIAEHLTPTGRSAVIVPEGIIFQSQKAYKQLRKLLVEEYLVAVVSLPAGLFQPYSGVKTSILVMDKALARQRDTVAFFTVNNDGFSLGAQRRPIEQNDLPTVQTELARYLGELRMGKDVAEAEYAFGHVVRKEKIAAGGEYSLSGERYRVNLYTASNVKYIPVASIFDFVRETCLPSQIKQPITFLGLENIEHDSGNITGTILCEDTSTIKSQKNIFKKKDILYGKLRPNLNKVWLAEFDGICSTDIFVLRDRNNLIIPKLFAFIFRHEKFNKAVLTYLKGAQLPRISWKDFSEIYIPFPPLEVQKEIVAEIEGYQKIIDGARAVVENYRPQIRVNSDWKIYSLETLCEIVRGSSPRPQGDLKYYRGPVPRLMVADITRDGMFVTPTIDSLTIEGAKKSRPMQQGDIVITVSGNPGLPAILATDACIHDGFVGLKNIKKEIDSKFLYFILLDQYQYNNNLSVGAVFKNLTTNQIKEFNIPHPPLEIQKQFVAEIEAEQALVNANKELIIRFEKKIEAVLARVWGEADESTDVDDLDDFELPDAELQFPLPGREDWAVDCIPCAIRQAPHRRFDDYYEATALGTIPNFCADLLPPDHAAEFQALIQKTQVFANCESGQRIRKELVQDALSEKGVHITPTGCSLPNDFVLEREDILAPIVPYLFEALEILRDIVNKASTSQRIKHLTPQKQQRIIETWNQGEASAA